MKNLLTLFALAVVALAAFGCDPAPKDEPSAAPSASKPGPDAATKTPDKAAP